MPPYTTPHAAFLGFPASTFASTITAVLIHHILVPKVSRYRDINNFITRVPCNYNKVVVK